MAIVDLTKLSQEQLWGIQYARQEANKPIKTANENLREGQKPQELYTDQSYADFVMQSACDSWYVQVIKTKKDMALAMFDSLSTEQQAAMVAQFGVPPVIQE